MNSLEFVMMFVPVEAAFIEAARNDDALHGFALERQIVEAVHLLFAQRERRRVEIHRLIAVRLESQTIQQLAAKVTPGDEIDQIRAKAQAITKLALDLYANGRRLVRRLRPEVLDMLGLHGAVEEMVSHYRSSSGVQVSTRSGASIVRTSP